MIFRLLIISEQLAVPHNMVTEGKKRMQSDFKSPFRDLLHLSKHLKITDMRATPSTVGSAALVT